MTTTANRAPLQAVLGSSARRQVAFCGPLGVGKTTAVRAGSTTAVSGSEVRSSLSGGRSETRASRSAKRTTTVGIEYGEWHPEGEHPVVIYGTPGQSRFSEARHGALSHRAAIVLWLFGQNHYALAEAKEWLDYLAGDVEWSHLTVVVTRLEDDGEHPALDEYRPLLDTYHAGIPLLAADPRRTEDVHQVLRTALSTLEEAR